MKNKTVRFDEKRDLIAYVESGVIEDDHIGRTIYRWAKYNYFVENLTDRKSYNRIIKFVIENSSIGFTDLDLYEFVQKTIKSVKKSSLKLVDHIYITKSELDFIVNLNDIKLEKIAFVILCLAKYHNEVAEEPDNRIYYKLNEIKNMARINMSKVDFEYFYNNLYEVGAIERNNSPTSTVQTIRFVSRDENDPIVMELQEVDYLELAYLYLSWKNNSRGYARCTKCGRLMRQSKTKPRKYCEECAREAHLESKRLSEQRRREKMRGQNLTKQND